MNREKCGKECDEIVDILKPLRLNMYLFEIDKMVHGKEMLLSLYNQAGLKEMPHVYVCNKYIGGNYTWLVVKNLNAQIYLS